MHKNNSSHLAEVFLSFWRHRSLIWQMTKREIMARYRGSVMGVVWAFLTPLLMLAVYTFVFTVVFEARWGIESPDKIDFVILLFAGLIVHALFAECVNQAHGLILKNVNYVTKVVFPLEILPWISLLAALFHLCVSVLVLLLFYLAINLSLHWTLLFLPFVLFPFVLLVMGLSWFLASLGVFLRDVGQIIGVIIAAALFLSPVFYPSSALGEPWRQLLYLNPLTFIIEQLRDILIWGKLPDWSGLGIYFLLGLLVAWFGLFWFQKTRKGFADVV